MSPPSLDFVVPVWGESYTETYLNYCLPAQLAPQNIPALNLSDGHRYFIFTKRADYELIKSSAVFRTLESLISVTAEFIDDALDASILAAKIGAKYEIKSNCYKLALNRARQRDAAVVQLNADIVLANGFVSFVSRLLARGKRVIEVVGPRGLRDPIGKALTSQYSMPDGSIKIEPIELSRLWLHNIHPLLQMHFVEGPEGAPFHPSHLYWKVGEEGILARCFHLYPIVVYPRSTRMSFSTTIDDDLVRNMRLRKGERFISQDSREMFCCELSSPEHYVGDMARRGDLEAYIRFYASYGREGLKNLDKENVIATVANLDAGWKVRTAQSKRFTRDLVRRSRIERLRRFVGVACAGLGGAVKAASRFPAHTIQNALAAIRRKN